MQQTLEAKLEREVAKDYMNRGRAPRRYSSVRDLADWFRMLPRTEYEISSFSELTFRDTFCNSCFTLTPEWYSAPPTLPKLCAETVCAVRRCGGEVWHLWWCQLFLSGCEMPATRATAAAI